MPDLLVMEMDDSQSISAFIFVQFVILAVSTLGYTALHGRMIRE